MHSLLLEKTKDILQPSVSRKTSWMTWCANRQLTMVLGHGWPGTPRASPCPGFYVRGRQTVQACSQPNQPVLQHGDSEATITSHDSFLSLTTWASGTTGPTKEHATKTGTPAKISPALIWGLKGSTRVTWSELMMSGHNGLIGKDNHPAERSNLVPDLLLQGTLLTFFLRV